MDDREEEREEHLISYLQDFHQLLETVAVSALCMTPVFRGEGRVERGYCAKFMLTVAHNGNPIVNNTL